jgi:cell division protein FtsI/penicillin-binding protein 2
MLALAVSALGGGAVLAVSKAGDPPPDPRPVARTFAQAWVDGNMAAMYRSLTPRAKRETIRSAFDAAYARAAQTGSLRKLRLAGAVHVRGATATIPMSASTKLFGTVAGVLTVPMVEVDGDYRVAWTPSMTFPGLEAGETLERVYHLPKGRGAILSEHSEPLAVGPRDAREYPQGTPFAVITGFVRDPQSAAELAQRQAVGWGDVEYGQAGLERSLDPTLAGRPGIRLVARSADGAAGRKLAGHPGRHPHNVKTTLSVPVQEAAQEALGDRVGGIVVLDARTGGLRAAVGNALTALQPPGSTFKTVTASAALAAGKTSLTTQYPFEKVHEINGFKLKNFHKELCGGSLENAFAQSCNSVFAPLAVDVGAKRMQDMAVRYGFNQTPSLHYPVPASVYPRAQSLTSDLQLGVTGIGQGGVVATPLQMASVAQVIAGGGVMHPPYVARLPISGSDREPSRRVVSPGVAAEVAQMMRAVVSYGTGVPAQSSLATVAGKTGTAELGPGIKSDAWFIGYAPAEAPRVIVSVLIVHGGVGGVTAAPIARQVIDAALQNP